jgi:DNA-binding transcriptional regulator GbsR (MarR family)
MALTPSIVALSPEQPPGLIKTGGRIPEETAFDAAMVEFFVKAADLLGIPKSVAAIYGTCFASPEPLSFADIEARLDISRGSISQGVRVLRDMGALKSVGKRDERREAFAPDLRLRNLIEHWLDSRLQKQLSAGQGRLQQLDKLVPGGRSASAKELRNRIKSLQAWHDKTRAVLPLVKTFLKLSS